MPVYIHPANLILCKKILSKKYKGGIEQFRIDFNGENVSFQEDDELFSLARMTCDEFPEDLLLQNGLEYDKANNRSEDYVIISRYGGSLWKVSWLFTGNIYSYHKACNSELKEKADLMEYITMDEVARIQDSGGNPFETIRKGV